jgi:hypothetical protein
MRLVPNLPMALVVQVAWLALGCGSLRHETRLPAYAPQTPIRGIAFVADGAGNLGTTSRPLRQVVEEDGAPLLVHKVEWSHGTGRILADQTDYAHARAEGRRLAEQVRACRQANPGLAVFLIAHCAGSAVVLSAAENLPPGEVDGIVLLSPSVSCRYDLAPALRSTRGGIDVFYSELDLAFLGIGAAIVGTADRRWSAPAGRVGVYIEPRSAQDLLLYARLRQHPWSRHLMATGHLGGHSGNHSRGFLRACVLPLLTADGPPRPSHEQLLRLP